MSRWGSTGIFDSSQLTAVKQTRNVYANALAQRTAVDKAGKPFMRLQSASPGQGGPINGFSIASDTGALNLTQAEFDAIVAQETPGPSGPPPTLTFTWNGIIGTQLPASYTVPAGYTSLAYILCGGGGPGNGEWYGAGGDGGGSGGYLAGTLSVSSGQTISITFGTGGTFTSGGNTELTVDSIQYTAGGGHLDDDDPGPGGIPGGTTGAAHTGANGGGGGTGGGGGGGGGAGSATGNGGAKGNGSNGASDGVAGTFVVGGGGGKGGDGYYSLIFT